MNSIIFKLLFLLICSGVLPQTGRSDLQLLGDRFIVEINKHNFTQRQLETYLGIKNVLRNSLHRDPTMDEKKWNKSLSEFTDDMIINLETQRLGRFQPQATKVQLETQKFYTFLNNDKDVKDFVKRLGIKKITLLKVISELIQIEDFKQLKGKDFNWKQNLHERYKIRFAEKSNVYIPINPAL
jgi:predicted component of type VI protein secretion system